MTPKEILKSKKELFDLYRDELIACNEQVNLTAITDPKEIESKHFLDSLSLLSFIPENAKTLVDVGSGAGFPGIPLAIARPDLQVTLIESVGKKAKFLEYIVETLKLKNVEVVTARGEDVGKHPDYEAKFDVGTARAVAKLDKLVPFVLPLIKRGGIFLAPKSSKENLSEAEAILKEHGAEIQAIQEMNIEGLSERIVAVIKKK